MLPAPTKLPAGIASFAQIREEGFIYVDKTQLIHRLVTEGKFYFLSRPRRFGKSLLVNTLKLLFQGRRDLFDGLWIGGEGRWDWTTPNPVVSLDFNSIIFDTPEKMEETLSDRFHEQARTAGLELAAKYPPAQFSELIRRLAEKTGRPVVVLVDEYDKPILDHLDDLGTARANRDVLKSLFRILKGEDVAPHLRLVFFTGVTKFSKVSIFSDLNQLRDLSLDKHYAVLLGWTQEELETNFSAQIAELAADLEITLPQTLEKLRVKYNGYRFSRESVRVYNPFSLLSSFAARELGHFWFASGTPTFLVNLIARKNFPPLKAERMTLTPEKLETFQLENLSPEGILFQAGYTTILDADPRTGRLTVGYPNEEVKGGLVGSLLDAWTAGRQAGEDEEDGDDSRLTARSMAVCLEDGQVDKFLEKARGLFASLPYEQGMKLGEAHFHTLFYFLCSLVGLDSRSEVLSSAGRMDLAIECPDRVYVIEFKCAQSADLAIAQILSKGYLDPYRGKGKKLLALGINFDPETRNLADTKLVEIP